MQEKRIQINGEDTLYLVREDGTIWSEIRNRALKGTLQRNEYHTIYLVHNGKQYNFMIHRLVAEAFCPNPNNYSIVHHKDNNPHNNAASNLEWVTSKENNQSENRKANKSNKTFIKADLTKEWVGININPNYSVNTVGQVMNNKTKNLVKGSLRNGYLRVTINGHYYSIHRLIYETFIGPIPEGMYIDHIDGNRKNNSLTNLRLVTQSKNMTNSMNHGHKGCVAVLQFDKDHNFIQEFPTIQAAAHAIGRTDSAIQSAILRGGKSGGYYWERKS